MPLLFRLRWRLAHLICPELGVEARLKAMRTLRNSVVVAVRVQDVVSRAEASPSNHNATALTVGLEELAIALPAEKRVVRHWLQDRLDLFLIAGGAYGVRGLTVGLTLIKFIHERALLGAGKNVANGLGLKTVDTALFLIEVQKRALHRYLLRLKSEQTIEEIRDQLLRRSGVDIGLFEQALDVMRSVRRTLGEAHEAAARSKDSGHGF